MTDDRLAAEVAKWLQHRVDSGLKPDSISAMSELMMLVAQKYYTFPHYSGRPFVCMDCKTEFVCHAMGNPTVCENCNSQSIKELSTL